MTAVERVAAVTALGFTPRQAGFLVTVALHGGYCLRRQYETFAGIQYGKNVREFLDGLVGRGLAERFTGRADRGHLYHLYARALYRAIGEEDNGHRRRASAAQIARKLMLLDYVLSRPDLRWYATQAEKIDLFVTRFGVPVEALPRQVVHVSASDAAKTFCRFAHKLPIYVAGDGTVPHFVYLATDGSTAGLMTFLRDHARLFNHLPRWTVVAVGPAEWPGVRDAFNRFMGQAAAAVPASRDDLQWYFERRRSVDRGEWAQVPVGDLRRFRALRERLATPLYEELYDSWIASGEVASLAADAQATGVLSVGQLVIETLPFAYEQFGSLPGVA